MKTTPPERSAQPQPPVDPATGRKARRDKIRSADRQAVRVAARQWGAISRAQATKAGLTADQIAYRVRTGQWRQPVWLADDARRDRIEALGRSVIPVH